MEDIKDMIGRLAEKADKIIASPETIERLNEGGLHFDKIAKRSLEENIALLFDQRKQTALEVAKRLPTLPVVGLPALESLYNEIRECIIFGLNGPAITLAGILVEFALKYATYIREVGGFQKYDADKWDEFEDIAFAKTIKRASTAGLLTDQQVKSLENFKEEIRNPYSHYNIRKITRSAVCEKVKVVNIETGELTECDIAAEDDPAIQAQAKPIVDAAQVLNVFDFACQVVSDLMTKVGLSPLQDRMGK